MIFSCKLHRGRYLNHPIVYQGQAPDGLTLAEPPFLDPLDCDNMTVSYRKKVRSRRSVFNLWIPNKAATHNNKCGPFPSDSPISDASPASEPIITTEPGKDRLKIRLTRSGSKLLLLLGLGSSATSKITFIDHMGDIDLLTISR